MNALLRSMFNLSSPQATHLLMLCFTLAVEAGAAAETSETSSQRLDVGESRVDVGERYIKFPCARLIVVF